MAGLCVPGPSLASWMRSRALRARQPSTYCRLVMASSLPTSWPSDALHVGCRRQSRFTDRRRLMQGRSPAGARLRAHGPRCQSAYPTPRNPLAAGHEIPA
jgi:hypothetical protein